MKQILITLVAVVAGMIGTVIPAQACADKT